MSAATGGIRTARRAGPIAEMTVTPTPTANATTAVRGSKTSDPGGSVMPKPLIRASSPSAASAPSPIPMIEDPAPTMAASVRTDRKTCPRLAPTIRNSASSLVRWPTLIENVLKIVKPPTNRAMTAKISSAVEKNASDWLTELTCSLATV